MFGRHGASGGALGPAVAGTWYPADAVALERQVDGFFREAAGEAAAAGAPTGKVSALIAPHAGFVYSGLVAARGFGQLGDDNYERVILLGPSHYAAFDGAILTDAAVYRTPLGEVPIDTEACETLQGRDGFRVDNGPFRPEHCLEAEIPFLQRRLGADWRVVPLLVGALPTRSRAKTLADGLRPLLGPDTLVVVSSDFTHYGPRFHYVPFERDVPSSLEKLDLGAVERILAWDAAGFEEYVVRTGATICGSSPIRVLLDLAPEGLAGQLAAYDTSGRITGDWDHSVSYASLVFRSAAA
jgi:AmmeMemoRadiSam system protein B